MGTACILEIKALACIKWTKYADYNGEKKNKNNFILLTVWYLNRPFSNSLCAFLSLFPPLYSNQGLNARNTHLREATPFQICFLLPNMSAAKLMN